MRFGRLVPRFGVAVLCLVALANPAVGTLAAPPETSLESLSVQVVATMPGIVLATSVPPTAGPAGSQDSGVRYTVKPGDTLTSIAAAFGVKASAIQAANGLQDANSIKVGQVLVIPPAGATAPPAPTSTPVPLAPTSTPVRVAPAPTPVPAASPAAATATAGTTAGPTAAPAPGPAASAQPVSSRDPMYFEETGFRIANDSFWNFFNRRGGVRTFGYPISKEFQLFGFRVQMFQRSIMQLRPDGSVATMNLLDEGMMPYTRINFSTFPASDGGMAGAAPAPGSEGYFDKLLAFVKEKTPDQWEGMPVNFYKTFNETVRYEDAYPDGKQDPGIMPAINLELWGVPTSAPAYDRNNKNFVYLRFQRGIMHYDKTTGATQGLLLGDYLKSVITGWNLPADLDEQARGTRFYRQYNSLIANGLARPNDLPGTDLRMAFTREGLVVLDPGHGGTEIGAAHVFPDNSVLIEKHLNLKVAQKTADLLRQAGRQVVLTRTSDTQVNNPPRDVTGDGRMTLDDDLQSRVDIANNSGAQLFLSIHFNGSRAQHKGAEVYYNAKRPFSDKNKQFAHLVLDNLLSSTRAAGYNLVNRGVKDDELSVGKGNSLYLLGPTFEGKPRATEMVGVLTEGAFLTDDDDAGMVKQEKFLDALAAGYAQAILKYFQTIGR